MKSYLLHLVFFTCLSSATFAQTSSSSIWPLSSAQSPNVTGNLSASNQLLNNMQISYTSGVQRSSPTGTAGSWPAETTENPTRYMQFACKPIAGFQFNVAAISIILYSSAGSGMRANVYYSMDSTFTSRIQIGTTITLNNTALTAPNVNSTPNLNVPSDQTIYLRIYPWYNAATTTKYLITKDMTISGTTSTTISLATSANSINGLNQFGTTPSGVQTYTLKGMNLTSNVTITPPEKFEISSNNGTTWIGSTSNIILPVAGGIIIGQPVTISVRMNAAAAGEFSGVITHSTTGTTDKLLPIAGIRFPEEPTVSSNLSFNNVTGTSMRLNFTGGNGNKRIVVARSGQAVDWLPTDGNAVSGVNPNFALAQDQSNGNKIIYDSSGTQVTVTGLSANTSYYFRVYEYNIATGNSQNYLTLSFGSGSQTTLAVPSITSAPASIAFGAAVANHDTVYRTYYLSANYLSPAAGSITISVPTGFQISLVSASGYANAVQLQYSNGKFDSVMIYARFIPTTIGDYSGSINHVGGSASPLLIPISGKGVSTMIQTAVPVGFATLNGGTTGGIGGTSVIVTDAVALAEIMRLRENRSTAPLIVYITGMISGYSTEISVKRTANVSILGVGDNAGFLGFGMKIVECQNIIIRNMTFADCSVDEKDGLCVDQSSNVWVDHCSFTDSPANDPSGNNHDGQLDVKNSAFNVTLSYNHFMNHRKTCLLGHTTNQTSDTALKVTYFRNWFDGTYSRHPRVRFAKAHIINNLYTSVGVVGADAGGYGVGVTCNAQIYNEANYYENTPKPTLISLVNDPGGTLSGDPTGYIKNVDNYTYNSGALIDNLAGFSFNPRNYYSYEIVGAELVKDIVQQNAGVGKITIPVDVRDVSVPTPDKFSLEQNYPNPFNPATIISYYLPAAGIVQLTVYDVLGNEVQTIVNAKQDAGKHSVLFNASSLNSGVYFYTLKSASSSQTKKMLLIK